MNRTAALILALAAALGSAYVGVLNVAQVREHVLEVRCLDRGGVPLWASSGPDDHRPDGLLPFVCAPRP